MYVFETVSVSLNLIMVLLALARGGWLNASLADPNLQGFRAERFP